MLVLALNDCPGRVDIGGLPAPEVAVASDRRHGLTRAKKARAFDLAAVDAVTQLQLKPVAAAEIARGRNAGTDHRFGADRHLPPERVVVLGQLFGDGHQIRIEHHVHVRIDQTGDRRQATAIPTAPRVPDRGDALAFDRDRVSVQVAFGDAVPDTQVAVCSHGQRSTFTMTRRVLGRCRCSHRKMPCHVPSASRPCMTGIDRWVWVSAPLMCAGISSAPSSTCV